ncbi:hypothetical protein D3C81_11600 [compost metagenome]
MTRKRFIKLGMSEGMDRNEAVFSAKCVLINYGDYALAYGKFFGNIRGRFEFYMPGNAKRTAKRNKKYCS